MKRRGPLSLAFIFSCLPIWECVSSVPETSSELSSGYSKGDGQALASWFQPIGNVADRYLLAERHSGLSSKRGQAMGHGRSGQREVACLVNFTLC
jgi:hypothetical protein